LTEWAATTGLAQDFENTNTHDMRERSERLLNDDRNGSRRTHTNLSKDGIGR
jgi:hypothetical protein